MKPREVTLLERYAGSIVNALQSQKTVSLPEGITTERQFKAQVILPLIAKLAASHPTLKILAPPWNDPALCRRHADEVGDQSVHRDFGCPRCWSESKVPLINKSINFSVRLRCDAV